MRHLLQFPPGDLVSCENWSSLKDAVSTALMDHNTELAVSILLVWGFIRSSQLYLTLSYLIKGGGGVWKCIDLACAIIIVWSYIFIYTFLLV